jgi:triacylglycerol esterase/lipase EstA (alpha/beta hydrolase family)
MTLKHNLIINIVCIYSYENLWCAPIVLVGHSFGGLVIKSLVVEIKRHMNQKTSNDMDVTTNARSKDFYYNLTGVIFYGTPHEGGTKTYSTYFQQICQETGFWNKTHSIPQQSLLNNVQCLNPNMEQLSMEFKFHNIFHY